MPFNVSIVQHLYNKKTMASYMRVHAHTQSYKMNCYLQIIHESGVTVLNELSHTLKIGEIVFRGIALVIATVCLVQNTH